jgi:regulator of RNase E activity RraA
LELNTRALFEHLRKFDTPTICNALEIVRGARFTSGFTRERVIAAFPKLPPIVGLARTAQIRCSAPFDQAARKQKLFGYYESLSADGLPTVAVIQDVDEQRGLGAFWGEVNTTVHWGLGCVGALTDGSMRDIDAMCPEFQCIAATLSPSHAFVQVADFGKPVQVLGMAVSTGDVIHADYHGAVVMQLAEVEKLPPAIDLMARREKVILEAARAPGFNVGKLREAYAGSEQVK